MAILIPNVSLKQIHVSIIILLNQTQTDFTEGHKFTFEWSVLRLLS